LTPTLIIIAVLAFALGAFTTIRRVRARRGILPASELQKRLGLYAEARPIVELDATQVPADLRHLVPFAEKWGIGDDIIRNDFIDRSSSAERRELHDALYEPHERITAWIDSFAGRSLSPEAEAFVYMQTALDEMGYFILDEKRAAPP
jgi:hypothetical protein